MRNLYVLLLVLSPLFALSQLTGYWQSDLGGCYQLTQNGNEVWWAGESPETMRAKNVFYGTVTGSTLNGVWCDLPSNTKQGFNERLSLRIEGSFKLVKTGETASYRGSVWTKLNGPCGSGTVQGTFYTNVAGTWYKNGEASMPCYITQDGANLSLTTDNNVSLGSFTSQNMIYANKWSTFGTLSTDGQTITWDNQTWMRQPTIFAGNYPNIAGTWFQNGSSNDPCSITQNGQNLTLQVAGNVSQGSFTSQNQIYANNWNTYGSLSSDGNTITWGNQTWTRSAGTIGGGTTGGVLEEISVPGTTRDKTYTFMILLKDVKYRLQISGTFSMWSTTEPVGVDALYAYRERTPQLWSPLYIDDKPLINYIKAEGGNSEYRTDHNYQVTITGTGKRLSFYLNDGAYSDNCGSIKIKVLQQQNN